jgi:hypothetical protein
MYRHFCLGREPGSAFLMDFVLDSVDVQSVVPMTILSKNAPGRGLEKEQELLTSGSNFVLSSR